MDALDEFPISDAVYGIEFYSEFYNFTDTHLCRIELLKKEYSGTVYEITNIADVTISHQGHGKDEWEDVIIQGQSLKFVFYLKSSNIYLIDPVFESDYKDYMVKFYVDGELEFIGWLQPENLTKNYSTNPPNIEISITAYDGLVDLQDFDFVNPNNTFITQGTPYSGKVKLLEIIKTALARTEIPLDFKVQLNTWEGITLPPPPPPVQCLTTEHAFPYAILTEDGKLIIIES